MSLQKYTSLISNLTQQMVEAIEKYMTYGQPLPLGGLNAKIRVHDVLWSRDYSLPFIKEGYKDAKEKSEALEKETDELTLGETDELTLEAVEKITEPKSYLTFRTDFSSEKIQYSWTDAKLALNGVYLIRLYQETLKATEAKKAEAIAKLKADIEKLQDKVSDKNPEEALKALLQQQAILTGKVAPVAKTEEVKSTDMI